MTLLYSKNQPSFRIGVFEKKWIYGYIYSYRCLANEKHYVGQSVTRSGSRRRGHEWKARANSKLAIHRALRKYSPERFEFFIVYVVIKTENPEIDQLALDESEIELIKTFNSRVVGEGGWGYNLKSGGFGGHHAASTRKKISKANASFLRSLAKQRKGKPSSPEAGRKISEAKTGRPNGHKGLKRNPVHAAKLAAICRANSDAMRGKPAHNRGKPSPLKGQPAHPNSRRALQNVAVSRRGKVLEHTAGSVWITNGKLSKRVKGVTLLPPGWRRGRKRRRVRL